ncbi:TPA: hypothetical protein NII17_000345 [Pseudomonas aeruginosa]|uniref:hypothetical protein n=1 Tax=Pseudomonas aeruginosa TaxID=287 RepID=UPI00398231A0|nr:hypothetical protein [Pseudomonas aeruginosa]HBP1309429.1 hypothetical protein [Pseudomonas aeruginosa]HCF6352951.1 hypothetical protein [Pseudomonas aeruginosa]
MNRYQQRILDYYRGVVIPSPNIIELMIALVSGVFLIFSLKLQMDDHQVASIISMIIGAVGLKHVLDNDCRRKVRRIRAEYSSYCQENGLRPSLLGLRDSMSNAKKIWFCMAHEVEPNRLFETARAIKEDYAAFKELDSIQNLSILKAGRLLLWFDNNRMISLLSIAVALLSVLALIGVDDTDLIVQAFFVDVFPVMISLLLYIVFGYLVLFFITPTIPAALGLLDLFLIRLIGDPTDRSIKKYIYDMMQASD